MNKIANVPNRALRGRKCWMGLYHQIIPLAQGGAEGECQTFTATDKRVHFFFKFFFVVLVVELTLDRNFSS